jgi:hypothetical protein
LLNQVVNIVEFPCCSIKIVLVLSKRFLILDSPVWFRAKLFDTDPVAVKIQDFMCALRQSFADVSEDNNIVA